MTPAALRAQIRKHPDGAKILAAVDRAKREGWHIEDGQPTNIFYVNCDGDDEKVCCVLGALDLRNNADFADAAITKLGWSHSKAWSLAYGFDGAKWSTTAADEETKGKHRREWQLGRLFRALLVEVAP